jgi:hypothetical protein
MKLIILALIILAGDMIINRIVKHFKTKKIMATNKYVAKRNEDGTVELFQVTDATGVNFAPTQILVSDSGETDLDALNSELVSTQATVDDLTARISAISLLSPPVQVDAPATDIPSPQNS